MNDVSTVTKRTIYKRDSLFITLTTESYIFDGLPNSSRGFFCQMWKFVWVCTLFMEKFITFCKVVKLSIGFCLSKLIGACFSASESSSTFRDACSCCAFRIALRNLRMKSGEFGGWHLHIKCNWKLISLSAWTTSAYSTETCGWRYLAVSRWSFFFLGKDFPWSLEEHFWSNIVCVNVLVNIDRFHFTRRTWSTSRVSPSAKISTKCQVPILPSESSAVHYIVMHSCD